MHRRFVLPPAVVSGFLSLLFAAPAFAQMFGDWTEGPVPPAPALQTQGLIGVDVTGSDLRFGIDPASITVGKDGVVHFVLVAASRSGAVNAMYEGVHCSRAEFRIYARHNGQAWRDLESDWRPLIDGAEARLAWTIARAGVCEGRVPGGTPAQIARALQTPADRKSGF